MEVGELLILRVVVDLYGLSVGGARRDVELLDEVGFALVQVDSAGEDKEQGGAGIYGLQEGTAGAVDGLNYVGQASATAAERTCCQGVGTRIIKVEEGPPAELKEIEEATGAARGRPKETPLKSNIETKVVEPNEPTFIELSPEPKPELEMRPVETGQRSLLLKQSSKKYIMYNN